jgi:hypothetical protein
MATHEAYVPSAGQKIMGLVNAALINRKGECSLTLEDFDGISAEIDKQIAAHAAVLQAQQPEEPSPEIESE